SPGAPPSGRRRARAAGSACRCHGSSSRETIARGLWKTGRALRGDARPSLEMLMRRAIIAVRQRRTLARLALARGRAATGDAAVEGAGLDLRLDERAGRADSFAHGPGDLRLRGDREVTAD